MWLYDEVQCSGRPYIVCCSIRIQNMVVDINVEGFSLSKLKNVVVKLNILSSVSSSAFSRTVKLVVQFSYVPWAPAITIIAANAAHSRTAWRVCFIVSETLHCKKIERNSHGAVCNIQPAATFGPTFAQDYYLAHQWRSSYCFIRF